MDPAVEERTAMECDMLISDVPWTVDAIDALIKRILDAMDANQIGSKRVKAKLEPLQVLRRKLLGLACHPSAIRRASAVWPSLAQDLPPEEQSDAAATPADHDETTPDF